MIRRSSFYISVSIVKLSGTIWKPSVEDGTFFVQLYINEVAIFYQIIQLNFSHFLYYFLQFAVSRIRIFAWCSLVFYLFQNVLLMKSHELYLEYYRWFFWGQFNQLEINCWFIWKFSTTKWTLWVSMNPALTNESWYSRISQKLLANQKSHHPFWIRLKS